MRGLVVRRVEDPGEHVAVQAAELVPGEVRAPAGRPQRELDDLASRLGRPHLEPHELREPPAAVVDLLVDVPREREDLQLGAVLRSAASAIRQRMSGSWAYGRPSCLNDVRRRAAATASSIARRPIPV